MLENTVSIVRQLQFKEREARRVKEGLKIWFKKYGKSAAIFQLVEFLIKFPTPLYPRVELELNIADNS